MLKMQREKSEAMTIIHFQRHLRKEVLQKCRNIKACNKRTLGKVLIRFRRNYVRLQSQTTAKHELHKLTFNPNTKSRLDFLEELMGSVERAFGPLAQQIRHNILHAKLLPHSKRSLNLTYLESGTWDQKVAHLDQEVEISGLERDEKIIFPRW